MNRPHRQMLLYSTRDETAAVIEKRIHAHGCCASVDMGTLEVRLVVADGLTWHRVERTITLWKHCRMTASLAPQSSCDRPITSIEVECGRWMDAQSWQLLSTTNWKVNPRQFEMRVATKFLKLTWTMSPPGFRPSNPCHTLGCSFSRSVFNLPSILRLQRRQRRDGVRSPPIHTLS